jgi:hypothetical protein
MRTPNLINTLQGKLKKSTKFILIMTNDVNLASEW